MEGISFRVREICERIYLKPAPLLDIPFPDRLRVDGGAAASDVFMQIQADILGIPVERMHPLSDGLWEALEARRRLLTLKP